MAIDLSQFHQTFFDESLEHLENMEQALLDLDIEAVDDELINTIFRAAHSIKGAAGTLGFKPLVEFTHVAETLLDQVRNGERTLDTEAVDAFLGSVDVLRSMVEALMAEEDPRSEESDAMQKRLEIILNGEDAVNAAASDGGGDAGEEASEGGGKKTWTITLRPEPEVLRLGNDIVRLIKLICDLGPTQVEADDSELPSIESFEPCDSYLAWTVKVTSACDESEIREIFEWIEDECEIGIASGEVEELQNPVPCSLIEEEEEEEEEAAPAKAPQAAEPAPAAAEAAPPAEKKSDAKKAAPPKKKSADAGSIRVATDKIDALVNMVGELVITQGMLGQVGREFDMSKLEDLEAGLGQLERNTRELQEAVMAIRMLPISFAFSRIPRMVRDLSGKLKKEVELVITGEGTELDKTVLEQLGDPLVHLVRNAVDHGIESPEERKAAGKNPRGTMHVDAFHQGGKVVINISDDGGGISVEKVREKARRNGLITENDNLTDDQVRDLIFHPGLSTAAAVTDVSGRGVGLDVVRRNIKELGGEIQLTSEEGKGSCFSIRLPLTMAILDGQLVSLGDQIYIIPLISIVESLSVNTELISSVAGQVELYNLRNEYIPIIHLSEAIGAAAESVSIDEALMVVVEAEDQKAGIIVDDLQGQQQVVIKSLETNFQRVLGISGATVLGTGQVGLIVDVSDLLRQVGATSSEGSRAGSMVA